MKKYTPLNKNGEISEHTEKVYLSEKDYVNCVSKEEYSDYKISKDTVVGACDCKEADNSSKIVFSVSGKNYKVRACKDSDIEKSVGAVKVGENKWMLIMPNKSAMLISIGLLCLVFFGIFLIFFTIFNIGKEMDNKKDTPSKTEENIEIPGIADAKDGDDIVLNTPKAEVVKNTYDGYSDAYVFEEAKKLPFVNSEKNVNWVNYVIYDKNNTILYESGLIKPGCHAEWNAYDFFNGVPGVYSMSILVTFYEETTETPSGFAPCGTTFYNPKFTVYVIE